MIKNPEAHDVRIKLSDDNTRDKAVKDMKKHLSPEDYKDFVKQIKHEDEVNKKLQKVFDDAEFVYRGVSKVELDSYNKTGKFGKDDGLFGFTFATVSPIKAQQFGKGQAVVKIKKSELGDNIKPMKFTAFGSNTGDDNPDFSRGIWGQGTEFNHQSVAIKSGSSVKAIDTTYKESCKYCIKKKEQVDLQGPQSTPTIKKKKKFEFKECACEWSDVVKEARFKAFTHSSSFVGNARYDNELQEMTLVLNGKEYTFCNVSERKFDAFEGASSKGAFFNREFKEQHDC